MNTESAPMASPTETAAAYIQQQRGVPEKIIEDVKLRRSVAIGVGVGAGLLVLGSVVLAANEYADVPRPIQPPRKTAVLGVMALIGIGIVVSMALGGEAGLTTMAEAGQHQMRIDEIAREISVVDMKLARLLADFETTVGEELDRIRAEILVLVQQRSALVKVRDELLLLNAEYRQKLEACAAVAEDPMAVPSTQTVAGPVEGFDDVEKGPLPDRQDYIELMESPTSYPWAG